MSEQPLRPQQEPTAGPSQPTGQEPAEKASLSDKKRAALLRYMAILFGVAFLLVLLSFLIQIRDSRETISDLNQSNASALQNAGKLQEENQALSAAKEELEAQLSEAQAAMAEAEGLESQVDNLTRDNEELTGLLAESQQQVLDTQEAYELLMEAAEADRQDDEEALRNTLSKLAPLEGCLSSDAKSQYDILCGKLTTEDGAS